MPPFLQQISKQIYSRHQQHLGNICIVLPNRRAALFIRQYLGEIIQKTSFLPEFYSIEDFITQVSGFTAADPIALQFRLYELHKKFEKEKSRPIDEFLPYASWMLSDFNEIDMYLVDPEKLFTYLSDTRAIKLWNPDGRPLTDFEIRYLEFFRSLNIYYNSLHKGLESDGLAYQGMAFRHVATNIDSLSSDWKWHKVVFAGFNALTNSEEKIIEHLLRDNMAEIHWDADPYYLDNIDQEAGYFLRKYLKHFRQDEDTTFESNFKNDKCIEIIGVPGNAGQVKYAGEIISKLIYDKGELEKTALVLPDEGLLIPLLNSIPEDIEKFNVTMGLSLNSTPLYALLDNLLVMYLNADRFSSLRKTNIKAYYSKDLIKIFNHPWVQYMEQVNEDERSINELLRTANKVFFTESEIQSLLRDKLHKELSNQILFPTDHKPQSILNALSALLNMLRAHLIETSDNKNDVHTITIEYIFQFTKLVQRLDSLLDQYQSIDNIKTFHQTFKQLASQQRIPFRGEPLHGLQVMGVLETRTLDFDSVIMLSVNEGTLPSGRLPNSFIPFEIKQEVGLPTYKHNDAVFAYHFYRLIQRAQKVILLYNTEGGLMGGGEPSRFITQIRHELQAYNPGISITNSVLTLPPPTGKKPTPIVIEKDTAIIKLLKKAGKEGFHPSSIGLYINCPLQFYFSRLLRIKEVEEAEETIDNRVMGIAIHETLNDILSRHLKRSLNKQDFYGFKKDLKETLRMSFNKNMPGSELNYGKNYLIFNVAEKMLHQLFDKEALWLDDKIDLTLLELEKNYSSELEIEINGAKETILIGGTIDRVDKKGDQIRIIDYKTGSVTKKQLSPPDWQSIFTDSELNKSFQVMMYSWLYYKKHNITHNLTAGILSLRAPGMGLVELAPPDSHSLDEKTLEIFEEHLESLISEIFNPAFPFGQTEDEKRCKYCDYKEICNRHLSNRSYN